MRFAKYFDSTVDKRLISPDKNLKDVSNLIIENLKNVCLQLDKVREKFGVVLVSSGYRSTIYNIRIGGALNSQHTKGEAIDFTLKDKSKLLETFKFIVENLDYDQVIFENKNGSLWIHYSFKGNGKNRKQAMTANFENGKMAYKIYKEGR